jgi:hypothetical protein
MKARVDLHKTKFGAGDDKKLQKKGFTSTGKMAYVHFIF